LLAELGKVQYQRKNYSGAIQSFEKCHATGSGDEVSYLYLGRSYEKQGETAKAVASFQKALQIKPNYYNAHFSLGSIYLSQEKYADAASAFKAALRADQSQAKAAYNYAVAMESQDQDAVDENIANWQSYVKLARKDPKKNDDELAQAEQHIKDLQAKKQGVASE